MLDATGSHLPTVFNLDKANIAWSGRAVLRDVSLDIKQGEKVAILGKSGAGKSTLLSYLYQQCSGGVAYCPQNPGLVPSLSAFHNIYMGQLDRHHFLYNALNLFFPFKREFNQIADLAKAVGLFDKLKDKAETLSGGQQQRTALARCLFQQQSIFLGDEPVSAVDERQAEALLNLIVETHQTVVIALHNTHHALKFFDRVIAISEGAIVLNAQTDTLTSQELSVFYSEPASPSAVSFVSESLLTCRSLRSVG